MKPQPTLQWLREPDDVMLEEADALALKFSHRGCASSRLVGGKGCQLALLTQLKSNVRSISAFLHSLSMCTCGPICVESLEEDKL